MKILIATHNPAKIKELESYLHSFLPQIELVSLQDLNIHVEPEEIGKTFLENAKLKAHFFAQLSNLPTIADDGGLEIDALEGQPGVKSRRWIGKKVSDEDLITYALKRMEHIPVDKRTARFTVVLNFEDPTTKKEFHELESIEGHIAPEIHYPVPQGFPYRSIFIVKLYNKYFSLLSEEEHVEINHRYKAAARIAQKIADWYHIS